MLDKKLTELYAVRGASVLFFLVLTLVAIAATFYSILTYQGDVTTTWLFSLELFTTIVGAYFLVMAGKGYLQQHKPDSLLLKRLNYYTDNYSWMTVYTGITVILLQVAIFIVSHDWLSFYKGMRLTLYVAGALALIPTLLSLFTRPLYDIRFDKSGSVLPSFKHSGIALREAAHLLNRLEVNSELLADGRIETTVWGDRGFRGANFRDSYGQLCCIAESSSTLERAIWVGVKPQVNTTGVSQVTAMHLTQDTVKELLPILEHFAETGRLPEMSWPDTIG